MCDASHRKFPLAVYYMHGNVYASMLLSQFISPSPSPDVSTSLSLCLHLYCCAVLSYSVMSDSL